MKHEDEKKYIHKASQLKVGGCGDVMICR